MSKAALALGAVAQLRSPTSVTIDQPSVGLGLAPEECDVTFLGQPPPMCGERFVGVYAGGRTNARTTYGLRETYSLWVVISMRIPRVPFDRIGREVIAKAAVGMDAFCDSIRALLAQDEFIGIIVARANTLIGVDLEHTNTPRGFETGLCFLSESDPQPVGGEWFHAEEDEMLAGVVVRQQYGGAVRAQSYEVNPVT